MDLVNIDKRPDSTGHFGKFGGRFVPETLMTPLYELEEAYKKALSDPEFINELGYLSREYAGRPTNLYHAKRLTDHFGKAQVYLKREDLCHTGAHKINNTLGQVLLAMRMGKTRIIAETGAGQHGVATATVAALLGLECHVYMGVEDIDRQKLNVFRMNYMGSEVIPVSSGSQTLKDATSEAIRDWVTNVDNTFYVIGSVVGPHPYPEMVREFQSVIGKEAREQILSKTGKLPKCLIACVGGGSNSIGLFNPFYEDKEVEMYGVEAAGISIESGKHAASITKGNPGVLHGSYSYLLQENCGQIKIAHSISAGLDYPGVGPEHSFYNDSARAKYISATDDEALEACELLCKLEGILPALESSHALAALPKILPETKPEDSVIVCLSGRGDKDVYSIARAKGVKL